MLIISINILNLTKINILVSSKIFQMSKTDNQDLIQWLYKMKSQMNIPLLLYSSKAFKARKNTKSIKTELFI